MISNLADVLDQVPLAAVPAVLVAIFFLASAVGFRLHRRIGGNGSRRRSLPMRRQPFRHDAMRRFAPATVLAIVLLAVLPGCREQRDQLKQALSGQPPVVAGSLEGEWQLADLNGGGAPGPAITLRFDGGDQNSSMVSGSSGCNRFSGRWGQDGRTLKLGPFAGTRMACAPAVLAVEQRFLAVLGDVTSLVFTTSGEAMLATPDGRRLRLRRLPPST